MTQHDSYKHTPLYLSDTIRLLKIRPGQYNESIQCDLFQCSLDQKHQVHWNAISYVWGADRSCSKRIYINKQEYHTTRNAYEVLHNLRHPKKELTIWIDAICIDQANLTEKTYQIQLMGEIYKNAQKVVVWLGKSPADPESKLACILLDQVQRRLQDGRLKHASLLPEVCTSTQNMSLPWLGLRRLFLLPWFRRLWVIQEVVLARSVTFYCGSHGWDFVTLEFVNDLISKSADDESDSKLKSAHFWEIATDSAFIDFLHLSNLRKRYDGPADGVLPRLPFSHLMNWTRRSVASDRRDHVYGLLGLANYWRHEECPRLEADYVQTTEEVFTRATHWCIQREKSLKVLSLGCSSLDTRLPSWVPDFSHLGHYPKFGYGSQGHTFRAGGKEVLLNMSACRFQATTKALIIEGLIVDRLRSTGPIRRNPRYSSAELPSGIDPSNCEEFLTPWCDKAFQLFQSSSMVQKGHLWQTLLGGVSNTDLGFTENEMREGQARFEAFIVKHPASRNMKNAKIYHGIDQNAYLSWRQKDLLNQLVTTISRTSGGRRFATTKQGTAALVLSAAETGDFICVIPGGPVPYIIRPAPERGPSCYEFRGEAYVDGLMHGEALKMGKKLRTIKLI